MNSLENLAVLAFQILEYKFSNKGSLDPDYSSKYEGQEAPLFVTWEKNKKLRGCIGSFTARPVLLNLKQLSLDAALNDFRFKPIELKDLPKLSCKVSVLENFEVAADPFDWTVFDFKDWKTRRFD